MGLPTSNTKADLWGGEADGGPTRKRWVTEISKSAATTLQ